MTQKETIINVAEVTPEDIDEALSLLKAANLPTEDIVGSTTLYSLKENKKIVGVIGLETHSNYGLLRSVCVSPEARNRGLASSLVNSLEDQARKKNLSELYLLTETASGLFQKLGYEVVNRQSAPHSIQETTQFSSVCPSSAIVMSKKLQS